MADGHSGARFVLATGLLLGLGYGGYELLANTYAVGIDYRVYHAAGRAVLAGEPFYGVTPPGLPSLFRYVYPPLSVLLFVPLSALGNWPAGFVVHTALTVLAGLATAWLLRGYLASAGVALTRVDHLLVAGYTVASVHAMPSLVFGQVNHHLALLLTVGFVALARDRETAGGVALGAAAFLKLFPALLGLWLVVRRRVRAIVAATAVGVGLSALGLVVFGVETTRRYVETAVLPRASPEKFAGGLDPTATYLTLRRPISVLLPGVDPSLYGPLAVLVCLPVLAVCYRGIESRVEWLLGVFVTLTVVLVVLPSYPLYLVLLAFPLVPLLYLFPAGRARVAFLAGASLTNLSIRYDEVREALSLLDASPDAAAAAESLLRPLFTLATPPLAGLVVMLGAAAAWRLREL